MEAASGTDASAVFGPLRPQLIRIAYRMLGSVADAEDVVQEAFLRWHGAERSAVQAPPASDRATARHLGRRVAEVTVQLIRGKLCLAV